jgi:hypothetical protein
MMIRCPSCTTPVGHHVFDLHRGGLIRCSACGHDWLEGKAVEVLVEPSPIPVPSRHSAVPDVDVQHLVSASFLAQEAFQLRRKRRRAAVAAWIGLALVALSPAAVAFTVPERVVAAVPATIGIYDWLGREVNIYGLEIRKVEMQHLQVDGQRIIAIKGEILNVSRTDRRIPWLRFGLKSAEHKEVYQWQLDTESRPLRPGESKGFITRISSPPEAASSVEIRFARAEEISSNARP